MSFLSKVNFSLKKPKIIIIIGNDRVCTAEAVYQALGENLRVKKITDKENLPFLKKDEILIFQTNFPNISCFKKLEFLIKKSALPILIITHLTDASLRAKTQEIAKLIKTLPVFGYLALNSDDEVVREINDFSNLNALTFGFRETARFQASDVKIDNGISFKLNYKGNIIPVRLPELFKKEQIYPILAVFCVVIILNLNLIKITENLKNYKELPACRQAGPTNR